MPKKFYHKLLRLSARHWFTVRIYDKNDNFQLCDSNKENVIYFENKELL